MPKNAIWLGIYQLTPHCVSPSSWLCLSSQSLWPPKVETLLVSVRVSPKELFVRWVGDIGFGTKGRVLLTAVCWLSGDVDSESVFLRGAFGILTAETPMLLLWSIEVSCVACSVVSGDGPLATETGASIGASCSVKTLTEVTCLVGSSLADDDIFVWFEIWYVMPRKRIKREPVERNQQYWLLLHHIYILSLDKLHPLSCTTKLTIGVKVYPSASIIIMLAGSAPMQSCGRWGFSDQKEQSWVHTSLWTN